MKRKYNSQWISLMWEIKDIRYNRLKSEKDFINNKHKADYSKLIRYAKSAYQRGLCFYLTLNDIQNLTNKPCVYCGLPANGIDRVNNDIGYTRENSVSCCSMCNFGKYKFTKEEYIKHCKQVYLFNF